jgi:hypothetical protein
VSGGDKSGDRWIPPSPIATGGTGTGARMGARAGHDRKAGSGIPAGARLWCPIAAVDCAVWCCGGSGGWFCGSRYRPVTWPHLAVRCARRLFHGRATLPPMATPLCGAKPQPGTIMIGQDLSWARPQCGKTPARQHLSASLADTATHQIGVAAQAVILALAQALSPVVRICAALAAFARPRAPPPFSACPLMPLPGPGRQLGLAVSARSMR